MKNILRTLSFLFLSIFSVSLSQAHAAPLPNCRDAWQGADSNYDFKENYQAFQTRLQRTGCEKDWTTLIYMEADNDLFPYALWDLYEMETSFLVPGRAGSTPKLDVIVQANGPLKDDMRRFHMFAGDAKYEKKTIDYFYPLTLATGVKSPVIESVPENDGKTEKQRLVDFLLWGRAHYPAKNYMIVFWGHGQGWKSYPVQKLETSQLMSKDEIASIKSARPKYDSRWGGIGFSESSGQWLDIPSLRGALDLFARANGKPADVYVSDSCLMQMLEVDVELASGARFLVGTSQNQDVQGLPYRVIFHEINTGGFGAASYMDDLNLDKSDEPLLVAKMIPTLMKRSLNPRHGDAIGFGDGAGIASFTASAITAKGELDVVGQPGSMLESLALLNLALRNYLKEDPRRSGELKFLVQNTPIIEGGAQDFGVFLGLVDYLLEKERKALVGDATEMAVRLRDQLASTKSRLDRTIVSYLYGSDYGVDEALKTTGFTPRAVSVWLPTSPEEYHLRRTEFMMSRFYKRTHWYEWLDLLYGAQ